MNMIMRQVNLLPESLQQAERIRRLRNVAVVLGGCTLAVILVIHFFLNLTVRALENSIDQSLMAHQDDFVQVKKEIAAAKEQMRAYYDREAVLIALLSKHQSNTHMLKVMGRLTSGRVWLTGLDLDIQKSACDLEGRAFNTRLVSEFMLELKRLPYFREVELIHMDKGESKEVTFKIRCHLS